MHGRPLELAGSLGALGPMLFLIVGGTGNGAVDSLVLFVFRNHRIAGTGFGWQTRSACSPFRERFHLRLYAAWLYARVLPFGSGVGFQAELPMHSLQTGSPLMRMASLCLNSFALMGTPHLEQLAEGGESAGMDHLTMLIRLSCEWSAPMT